MNLDQFVSQRKEVSVAEYETTEQRRDEYIESRDYEVPRDMYDGWFEQHYRGSGLLTLKGVADFRRLYEWS